MYLRKLYYRTFQTVMKGASHFLPWRKPRLLEGNDSIKALPAFIKSMGVQKVLIVTDRGILAAGIAGDFLKAMDEAGVSYVIYDKTVANPTLDNIEEAYGLYRQERCSGLVAFGGGSPIDCAKGVGVRVARPRKSIGQLRGILRVWKRLPPLFAVPTTAGTGSEATLAAVITDSKTHDKYAINDLPLIPLCAVLDPVLTVRLPPPVTATTGMDALTHAVEAYIGRSNTRETREYARKAVKLVFDNVYEAWANGSNLEARRNMLLASHYAGIAFTRAYVGNVHAVAHTLGGFYSTPHGLANAVILPVMLEYYGEAVFKPLAELADLVGITRGGEDCAVKAGTFIEAVKQLNQSMEIPSKISGIHQIDIPIMAKRALKEANPLYPVPVILDRVGMMKIYDKIRD